MPSHKDIPGLLYDPQFESLLASKKWQVTPCGYVQTVNRESGVSVGRRLHRLIWEAAHGECPAILDHINGNKLDNRLCNLRPATGSLNARNRGSKGVRRKKGAWDASVCVYGHDIHIGRFPTEGEAMRYYAYVKDCLIAHEAALASGGEPPELRILCVVRNLPASEVTDAVRRLAPDHTIGQIADALGICYGYACRLVNQMGLEAPRKPYKKREPRAKKYPRYEKYLQELPMSDTSPVDPQSVSQDSLESSPPQNAANEPKRRPGRPRKPVSPDPEVMEKRLASRGSSYYLTYIEKLKREGRYEAWCKKRTDYMREYQRRRRAMRRAERTSAARSVMQSLQPVEGQHSPVSEVRLPGVQDRAGVESEVTPDITLGDLFG